MLSEIIFRPYDWKRWEETDHEEEQKYHVELYAHNRASEPVLIRVHSFNPYCYFELPNRKWSQADIADLTKFLSERLGPDKPIKSLLQQRKKFFFYQESEERPLLLLSFPSENALRHCVNYCNKYPVVVAGARLKLIPREQSVSQLKKLATIREISYVSWLSAKGEELTDERKISKEDGKGFTHEYWVDWHTLTKVPEEVCGEWKVEPTILSYDIEVLSYNPKKFPSALNVKDEIFMIGATFQRLNHEETRRHYVLVYGEHAPITQLPNTEVRKYSSEIALLKGFFALIEETNPDLLLTFNGLGFDNDYMDKRLATKFLSWDNCSRIERRKVSVRSLDWESGAYGRQELYIPQMDGRISIDMMVVILRDYKLREYNLDFCSHYFLKLNKVPLSPERIFLLYKLSKGMCNEELGKMYQDGRKEKIPLEYPLHNEEATTSLRTLIERGGTLEEILAYYASQAEAMMAIVGYYCLIDTLRPLQLFVYLNVWTGLTEQAEVVRLTIQDSYTRGQQVRVFSQLYDYVVHNKYYIDEREVVDYPFEGGKVQHLPAGLYRDVCSFDFNSLYPSLIQAYNICYTTFVPEGSKIPDEHCNIVEWESEGVQYRFRFIKKDFLEGLLPKMLTATLDKRKATKKLMGKYAKGEPQYNVLNVRQNSYKVSANSVYGYLGVKNGKLPFLEGAMCVTALGRINITRIENAIKEEGGVVRMGDTDSILATFVGQSRKQIYAFGQALAEKLSKMFPKPMKIELERVYGSFILVTPKRYMAVLLKEDGTVEENPDELYAKGVILARRDNCHFAYKLYKEVVLSIMYSDTVEEGAQKASQAITNACLKLYRAEVPYTDLTISKSVREHYALDSNPLAVFGKRLKGQGINFRDGDRLSFLYCVSPLKGTGNKMVLEEEYASNPSRYAIDRDYYISNVIMKPVSQLYEVAYSTGEDTVKPFWIMDFIQKWRLVNTQVKTLVQQASLKTRRILY